MERVRLRCSPLYLLDRSAKSPMATAESFSGLPWGTESTFFLLPPEGLESIWSLSALPQRHKMRSSAGTHAACEHQSEKRHETHWKGQGEAFPFLYSRRHDESASFFLFVTPK